LSFGRSKEIGSRVFIAFGEVFPVAFTRKPGAAESCNLNGNSDLEHTLSKTTLMLEKHRDLFDWELV